jgi:diacylglycerol kinase (ATP)
MVVGLIVNPTAGRGAGRSNHQIITEAFTRLGVEILDLTSRSSEEAEAKARVAIANQKIDALVVAGGDGMVHLGVNLVADAHMPLGIIACGTGNDSARALGLPINDVQWAAQIAADHLAIPRKVDIGLVENDRGKFYFFGSISAGFDALVNARANKWKFPKGPSRYKFAMFRELASFKKLRYRLIVDGEYHELDAMLCAITNVNCYGGGMMVTPDAKPDDGELDLFIVHKISRPELIKIFPSVYTGGHVVHPAVEIVRVKNVELDSGKTPAFADGEPAGHSPMKISVVPAGLQILGPAAISLA